jgi:hypothetical protein
VEAHNAEARLHCDYDMFCKGNVDASRAVGINMFAIELFRLRMSDPLQHYELILGMRLNEVSTKLIKDLTEYSFSGSDRRKLKKRLSESSAGLSNKTRFALEALLI